MKILELQFKNLNSLYGEWIIDFTDPEYVVNGIFALTGPTGAGKSTVLDAICLALYGSTPRLGRITKTSNEIMSRQTGECWAEVVFESQAKKYRCHWEQRRARKNPDGNLQDPEHHISDASTGDLLETKKSLVGEVIEEKTGMDFDRFTRSILLAQGRFDTFLKAHSEGKSKILEQITGTEIYSEISREVHKRHHDEQEKLNILQAEVNSIEVLEPDQEQELHNNLIVHQQQEHLYSTQLNEIQEKINWLNGINDLGQEISKLEKESSKLAADRELFEPAQVKLTLAIKAGALEGPYATLTSLQQQQAHDQQQLTADEAELPKTQIQTCQQEKLLQTAEEATNKAKEEYKIAAPLIQKIRLLDQKITEQTQNISEITSEIDKDSTQLQTYISLREREEEKLVKVTKELTKTQDYLEQNSQDEWLISGLTGLEEQFNNLLTKQGELTQKQTDLLQMETSLADSIKNVQIISQKFDSKKEKLETTEKELQQQENELSELLGDTLLQEYRTQKETLLREMVFIKRIEELEAYRACLEDGKPCPVCGSPDHPYAQGNIPVPDELEQQIEALTSVIEKAEQYEANIKKAEQAKIKAQNALTETEKQKIEATHHQENTQNIRDDLDKSIKTLQIAFTELKENIIDKLAHVGIKEIPSSDPLSVLQSLKDRLKTWQKNKTSETDIEKQITDITGEIKHQDTLINTQNNILNDKQETLQQLTQQLTTLSKDRQQSYEDKNPDEEEKQLNRIIFEAEQTEKNTRNHHSELQQKLTALQTRITAIKNHLETITPELEQAQTGFSTLLSSAGFTDEQSFLNARIPSDEQELLTQQAHELEKAKIELETKYQDRRERLSIECAKNLTDKTLEELQPQIHEYKSSLEELRNTITDLKLRLASNTTAKERLQEKYDAMDRQRNEFRRWDRLHGLIGSADGKKYRNFAQGLTFELMVKHANQQLEKMTDRYLLVRDEFRPLELNVIDNYQAGEIRSIRNLSGGETFIVSLTLALGLSEMSSKKVRVDSLFLDEGFGTLDEDALETALQTLATLQQDNKLIGIISHVEALKERIGTQISITPLSGGRSKITGPGCKRG